MELKTIFRHNGYPAPIVDRVMQQTLEPKERFPTVPTKPVYIRLPWLGPRSAAFSNQIRQATVKVASWCNPRVVFTSRKMLNTSNKDALPTDHISNVIYLFSCDCGHSYVGRTIQRLGERARQHVPPSLLDTANDGSRRRPPKKANNQTDHVMTLRPRRGKEKEEGKTITTRTGTVEGEVGLELKSSDSAITRHLKTAPDCLKAIQKPADSFSILAKARNALHLGILEAIYIEKLKPKLCAQKDFVRSLVLFR